MAKKKRKTRKKTKVDGVLLPAKGTMRDMADELWRFAVYGDWGYKCAVCGKGSDSVMLNPHHIIPRQHEAVHFSLRNGICLCSWHHLRDPDVSPHVNAAGWVKWLKIHHEELHDWYLDMLDSGDHKRFSGTKNWPYYVDTILALKPHVPAEDFERVCGVKFSAWLKAEDETIG